MGSVDYLAKGEELFDFFSEINSLKRTLRFGKTYSSDKIKEFAAGHSWELVSMVPFIAEQYKIPVDVPHSMKLAIVHDLGEYQMTCDFEESRLTNVTRKQKEELEMKTMESIQKRYSFGDKVFNLWNEFRIAETYDSRYVNALDKIEGMIHCVSLECDEMTGKQMRDFMVYADKRVKKFPELEPFLRGVKLKIKPILDKKGLKWLKKYNYPFLTE